MVDVGIDVGKYSYMVAVADGDNQPEVFSAANTPAGRAELMRRLADSGNCRIGLEQIGGWVRPLDRQILTAGHQLVTIHPLRLTRARDLFGQGRLTSPAP